MEINDNKEPTSEVNEKLSRDELVQRYAEIQNISIEQAEQEVGAPTDYEVLKNIEEKTIEKIRKTQVPMNRAQRRALKKKVGSKKYAEMVANGDVVETISETAKKLNYIDLIQKLRKLNEEKEKENGETTTENN
ncbi:MAG: hypothetical protein IKR04_07000 [Clostridia bacterium]|nr:hypothetical protein [Clostridia bacterium]